MRGDAVTANEWAVLFIGFCTGWGAAVIWYWNEWKEERDE